MNGRHCSVYNSVSEAAYIRLIFHLTAVSVVNRVCIAFSKHVVIWFGDYS